MAILSDKEIRNLCTPPSFVITVNVPTIGNPPPGFHYSPTETKLFSHLTEEKIKELIDASVIDSYRKLTEEELASFKPMIAPFVGYQVRTKGGALCNPPADEPPQDPFDFEMRSYRTPIEKVISYGLSSYGYDVRLADEFKIFNNIKSSIIDPLDFDQGCLIDHKGPYCVIPPNSYILGKTVEYFDIPQDVMVICVGKSTYARLGAIVNVTPIEPGFKGNIVIEISNATSLPLKIYSNMGISQFLFFKGNVPCEVSYADRSGKYQGQTSVQTALT